MSQVVRPCLWPRMSELHIDLFMASGSLTADGITSGPFIVDVKDEGLVSHP